MNRIVKFATPMVAAALIAGALAGCGGQAASSSASASATSEGASASASATAPASPSAETQATTEEAVTQLKAAMENAKDFKTVTITHNVGVEADASQLAESASAQSASAEAAESSDSAEASDAASAESTSLNTTTVYKFDQSGDAVKASSSCDFQGSTYKSFVDGDKAVIEIDGGAFAGTVEEMSAQEMTSVDELLKTKVGDFEAITSCVSAADVDEQGDNTIYALTIDPDKYAETDEIEKALADAGFKNEVFTVSYEFGADGKLLSVSVNTVTAYETTQATLNFTDYDATVVDSAPKTDKTYADMSAEIQKAVDALNAEEREALQNK